MANWAGAVFLAACGCYLASLFSSDLAVDLLGTSYQALPSFIRRQMWRNPTPRARNGALAHFTRGFDLCLIALCLFVFVGTLVYGGSPAEERVVSAGGLIVLLGWVCYLLRLPRARVR